MPSPSTMDYKEEQEQHDRMQAEPQAKVMETDEYDAPYLNLQDYRE